MGRARTHFIERINPNGEVVILGQFWELQDKGRKPPRQVLCTKEEAERSAVDSRGRPRSFEEKIKFLTRLYNEKLRELEQENKKEKQEIDDSQLISVIMQKWLDHVSTFRSGTTAEIYMQSVNHYIAAVGDHHIESYQHEYNTLLAERLKHCSNRKEGFYSTANQIRHIKAIQIFFNWAYQKEYISRIIRLDKPLQENKDIEVYTMDDLARLNKHILKRIENENHSIRKRNLLNHRRAFILALNTLLRRGPIWSLLLKNIDLERRIIRIRNNPELKWKNKKNKQVNKPINQKLFDYLLKDLESRKPEERYYLDNGKGQTCYKNPIEISRGFSRHCKKLDIPHIKPFHGIRSTMITEAILNGVDIKIVKELADHESIVTTEKYANAKRLKSEIAVNNLPVSFDF